jgi:hypothetical protein
MSHLVSFLNVAIVMAHSAYGGVDMFMTFSCQEYKSRRGWHAVSHMLALKVLSQSDLIITLTYSVFVPSLRLGAFCSRRIKCLYPQHDSFRCISICYNNTAICLNMRLAEHTTSSLYICSLLTVKDEI